MFLNSFVFIKLLIKKVKKCFVKKYLVLIGCTNLLHCFKTYMGCINIKKKLAILKQKLKVSMFSSNECNFFTPGNRRKKILLKCEMSFRRKRYIQT